MKQALLGCAVLLWLSIASNAQETVGAPYNPDSNADSLISVPDILSIIPLFGQEFLPSEDDLDSTNEIQSLYISNDTLYLVPNGGFILLGDIAPQINLDSLVSSLSVDSTFLASQTYDFSCVDMGIGPECAPQGGIKPCYTLEAQSGYKFGSIPDCTTVFDASDEADVTWRKFQISHPSIGPGTQIALKGQATSSLSGSVPSVSWQLLQSPIIEGNTAQWYMTAEYSNPNCSTCVQGSLGPTDAVEGENSLTWYSAISGAIYIKSHFEVMINNGNGFFDTGIRFTIEVGCF